MTDRSILKQKLEELAGRDWPVAAIEARIHKLSREGWPRRNTDPQRMASEREEILDRVQLRAEEYNLVLKNCAQSTALSLLEEFGLGNMEVIKALTPFPGLGGTGQTCGGVTGSLVALGLFFGSDDRLDLEALGRTIGIAQQFMAAFQERLGHQLCARIHEDVIFGRNMDPGAGPENMAAFVAAKGFEKCGLAAGLGARIAAEFITGGFG